MMRQLTRRARITDVAVGAALLASPALLQGQTATISGQVTSEWDRLVTGAEVRVVGTDLSALTNEEGRYVLTQVPPGRVELLVSGLGHAPGSATLDVSAGATVTQDFRLLVLAVVQPLVVTAQRREQFIQDVGISLTALDGNELPRLGMLSTMDLAAQLPGVYIQEPFGAPGETVNIAIRGVGLNDFNDGTESPSVLYVDEFYVLPISASSMMLYDAQRVEVLRGPQGTLFGRNVTGGLVHYVTRDPVDRYEGYLRTDVGSYGRLQVEGAANVPVSDRVAVRFSGVTNRHSPWLDNAGPARDGHEADFHTSVRGQIGWDVTDDLRSITKLTYSSATGDVSVTQGDRAAVVDEDGFVTDGGPGPFVSPEMVADFTIGETDSPEFIDNDMVLANQRFIWNLGSVELTSVTGYLDFDRLRIQDCDGTPLDSCRTRFDYGVREFTQEVRATGTAGRTTWTTGLYYLNQRADAQSDAGLDSDGTFGEGTPGFGFGGPFVFDVDWDSDVDGWAAFGQVEHGLSDRLTLTAGLRYSRDSKTFEMTKLDFVGVTGSETRLNAGYDNMFPGVFINGIGSNINFTRDREPIPVDTNFDLAVDTPLGPAGDLVDRDDNLVNSRLGLDWRPTENVLVFGSWSRGTKSGGFNNGFVTVQSNEDIPFDSETLNAYEVGVKATIGRLGRVALAGFHYDYGDYQAVAFQGLGTRTLNRDATLNGGELEFFLTPTVGLDLQGGVTLLDTEVPDISNGATTFDAEMGLAPDVSVKALARYSIPIGLGTLSAQGDLFWVDDQFTDVLNHPGLAIPAHSITNVSASYARGAWELAAWVRNLTNEQVPNARFTLGLGTIMSWYRPPRWFGASIGYRW